MVFAIHRHESARGVHVSPHPEPPSYLPPQPIPLGWARALSALPHASNLHWSSILHRITYMFQCYSLNSSHPCPLPLSPKVSLHLCLFCCPAYRVVVTLFLNSYICVNILYWCFSFDLTSFCIIGSSFAYLIRTDSNAFFFFIALE